MMTEPVKTYQSLYVERWERMAAGCPARVTVRGSEAYCLLTTERCAIDACVPQHWDPA